MCDAYCLNFKNDKATLLPCSYKRKCMSFDHRTTFLNVSYHLLSFHL